MPQLGETVAEGKILAWFKSIGDEVREGDNLFEVETDKVTVEVQAIIAGRLSEIRVGPGVIAKVGEIVAVIKGDAAAKSVPPSRNAKGPEPSRWPFEEVSTPIERFGRAKGPDGIWLTPAARRVIAKHGLDLTKLAADARKNGHARIDGRAVRAALYAANQPLGQSEPRPKEPSTQAALSEQGRVIALNPVRLKTADRLAENWRTIPHVFQAIEVDFTEIERVRAKHKEDFRSASRFTLTYLPFVARAVCLAIQAFPQVNSRLDRGSLILSGDIHLSIAVDLDHNGLVAPVVRDAGDFTLIGLAKAIRRHIEKARAGKLTADDLSGGTYSISNNGAFGTTFTTPIINAPQVAILSIDAIGLKPAVVSTPLGDFVAPRMIGMIGQSFDHRAFDGAYSAAFLSSLKRIVETRNWGEDIAK
jgi:pyruvate/2-oxoglutarate dehydrogenase complex dihydrolipoamide acyltransferase (E2) component